MKFKAGCRYVTFPTGAGVRTPPGQSVGNHKRIQLWLAWAHIVDQESRYSMGRVAQDMAWHRDVVIQVGRHATGVKDCAFVRAQQLTRLP
jgi:hypothetical protein